MTILYQKSIAEIAAQPLPRTEEVFTPTDEDRKRGNWAVVFDYLDEDGEPFANSVAHIIPIHGMLHQLSEMCACDPEVVPEPGNITTVRHRISQ